MKPNLNSHQWKLIFTAVRKQQHRHLPDSKWYNEHTVILNEIFDLAYSETYLETTPPPYEQNIGWTEANEDDWKDFWEGKD